MKLFKRLKKFIKTCLLVICVFLGASHVIQVISLSNEARIILNSTEAAPAIAYDLSLSNFKEALTEQLQRNQEAQERYERNRTEAVKHRMHQIEAKKEELNRMADLNFNITGDPVNDSITLARYKIRQACLRNDWQLGSFATEEEMMMLSEIRNKKIEGEPLTNEEMQFYSMMNGTRRHLEKTTEKQEKEVEEIIEKEKAKEETRAERSSIFQRKQDELYKKRNIFKNTNIDETQEVGTISNSVTSTKRGKRIVYIFQDQQDVITCGGPYLSHILEHPESYIIRIKNQRIDASHYKRLDQNMIDFINHQNLAITHTFPTYGDIELYFAKGDATRNKISSKLAPLTQEAIEAFSAPKVPTTYNQNNNYFDKSKNFMEHLNEHTKTNKPAKTLDEKHYEEKLKIIEKSPNRLQKAIDRLKQ